MDGLTFLFAASKDLLHNVSLFSNSLCMNCTCVHTSLEALLLLAFLLDLVLHALGTRVRVHLHVSVCACIHAILLMGPVSVSRDKYEAIHMYMYMYWASHTVTHSADFVGGLCP